MKKSIIFLILIFLCGCCTASYRAKQEKKEFFVQELSKKMPPPPEEISVIFEDENFARREIIEKEIPSGRVFAEKEKVPVKEKELIAKKDSSLPGKKVSKSLPEITSKKTDLSSLFSAWKGECLVYEAKWNFITVGKGLIACQEENTKYGNVYHFVGITFPEGIMADMGYGYNRVDSYIDKKTLKPYYFYSYIKNGKIERVTEVEFHSKNKEFSWKAKKYKKGKLYSVKKGKVSHNDIIHDSISVFYILRTLDFNGEKNEFKLPVGITKLWALLIKVKEKRKGKVPFFGEKEVYVVEPQAKSDEGLFKKGKMVVWLTADERKIPVYFTGKMALGTGNLSLISTMKLDPDVSLDAKTVAWILNSVKR